MQSKDLLLAANQQCAAMTLPLLEDLRTAPLATPVAGSGNHAHWILGHLVLTEHNFRFMMDGTPNARENLRPLFGRTTTPDAAAASYPSYDELLAELKSRHEAMLGFLESLSEENLDQPSKANPPPGFEAPFGTWRRLFLTRALHWMNHRGQLADCRRAAGRAPLML